MSLCQRMTIMSLALLMSVLVGCSSNDAGQNPKHNPSEKPAPEVRWPEQGDYSYDLSDNGCHIYQHFFNKADYCVALMDREKNHDCALDARQRLYASECGNDFEEANIETNDWFGWDDRLNKSCSTARPPQRYMPTLSEYCNFLKDEKLHELCHWNERYDEFRRTRCRGEFSEFPDSSAPTPTPPQAPKPEPTPAPTPVRPTPAPTPTPDTRPAIVKELEAAGVKVTISYPPYEFGEKVPFRTQLQSFYKTLESIKNQILGRKMFIKSVNLTSYTTYDSADESLNMDIYLSEQGFQTYFPLLDRRVAVEKRLGMHLDLRIELYGIDLQKELMTLDQHLMFLEKNAAALSKLKAVVKSIEVEDFSGFWMFNYTLKISEKEFERDLTAYIQKITPIVPFYEFAKQSGIKVETNLNFDDTTEYARLVNIAQQFDSERSSLSNLVKLNALKEIVLYPTIDSTSYFAGTKALWPATVAPGNKDLLTHLKTLSLVSGYANELKVEISILGDKLDKDFIVSAKRMTSKMDLLRRKKSSLSKIVLGYTTSSFNYKVLYIGATDSDAAFEKVLKSIP